MCLPSVAQFWVDSLSICLFSAQTEQTLAGVVLLTSARFSPSVLSRSLLGWTYFYSAVTKRQTLGEQTASVQAHTLKICCGVQMYKGKLILTGLYHNNKWPVMLKVKEFPSI